MKSNRHRRSVRLAALAAIATMCSAAAGAAAPPDSLEPFVIDVTNDGTQRWGEPQVAVNPKNPDNIVYHTMTKKDSYHCVRSGDPDCKIVEIQTPYGATVKSPDGQFKVEGFIGNGLFVSFDRGRTWRKVELPRKIRGISKLPNLGYGGDPVIEAGPDGTFYASWEPLHLRSFPIHAPGNFGCPVVSKSTDGGLTWSEPVCTGTPVDHQWLEIDHSTGIIYEASAGVIGATATADLATPTGKDSDRWLVTSRDAVTWSQPRGMGGSDGKKYHSGGGRMVASNGVLATVFTARNADACKFFVGSGGPCIVFQTTRDAGKTWRRYRMPDPGASLAGTRRAGAPATYGTMLADDRTRPGHYVVAVSTPEAPEFLVYRTSDFGATWSGPVSVSTDKTKNHFKAAIASSPNGTIGMMWRLRQPDGGYDIWATVSEDRGASFAKPIRISKTNSLPEDPNHIAGGDDLSDIHMTDKYAYIAWDDWAPGDRQSYFGEIAIEAFRRQ